MKILTRKFLYPSARLLRENLQNLSGEKIWITSDSSKCKNVDFLIRYGDASGTSTLGTTEINTKSFILSCGKRNFSESLSNINSKYFQVVKFKRETPENFPVVVRKLLNGYGGQGIVIAQNMDEFKSHFKGNRAVWADWFNIQSEYRVHIYNGKMQRIFKKVPKDNFEEGDFPIRTSENYRFSLRSDHEKFGKLEKVTEQISSIFTEHTWFLGLDVGWSDELKKYIVFEANTAPGLNTNSAEILAEFLFTQYKESNSSEKKDERKLRYYFEPAEESSSAVDELFDGIEDENDWQ